MSTCIYYDLELIERTDVLRTRAAAGGHALEIAPSGAHTLAGVHDSPPERLDGPRVRANQDRTMAWVEKVREGLERAGLSDWSRRGANLFEVSRYEFFQGVLDWEHRWWVAQEIRRRWAPTRLLWVARPARRREHRDLLELAAALSSSGLRTEYWGQVATRPLHRDVADTVRERLFTVRERFPRLRRARPTSNGRSRILFTDYFSNNLKSLYPVADELYRTHGEVVGWLAGRQEVHSSLQKKGIQAQLIDDFVSMRTVVRARLSSSETSAARRAFSEMKDVAPPWLAGIAARSLMRSARTAAFWIEAYNEAFDVLRPDVIASAVSIGTMGRAAATQVQSYGGRSIHLQHGMYPDRFLYSFYLNDLKLVWGEYDRKGLLRFGHNPESVLVTGAPLYDSARPTEVAFDAGAKLRIGYLPTLSSAITLSTAEEMLRAVAIAARALGASLSVKPHPGDRSHVPETVLRDFPEFRLARDQDPGDVIRASDIVIVVISSVGNEACLAGRPLISFNMEATGWEDHTEYARYGASLPVSRPEDLLAALTQIRDDPALRDRLAAGRRALIDDMLNGARGDAARKSAEKIVACLKEQRSHA